MQINPNNNISCNLDNRKKILYKYFEKPGSNILKINSTQSYENFFLIYNENINESIILLKLNSYNKDSIYADFEIHEVQLDLMESFSSDDLKSDRKHSKILGAFNHLDKLYIVNSVFSVFIIDLSSEDKKFYKLKIDREDVDEKIEICDYSAFAVVKPKIVFTGGVTKDGNLNKEISSFDISTYSFELNKVRENNFIGRYRHGVYSDNSSYIYVLGGFTKILTEEQVQKINEENSAEFICEKIQLIKFDSLMETYMELQFEGKAPKLMIDPYIQVLKERYLFAFSKFKYEKIWYLDINSNNSNEISLNYLAIPMTLNIYNGFFFSNKDNGFIACYPVYGEQTDKEPGEMIQKRESDLDDESKFNFAIKFFPMVEENI